MSSSTSQDNNEVFLRGLKVLQESLGLEQQAGGNTSLHVIGKPLTEDRRKEAIHRIELVVLKVIRQLVDNEDPELQIPRITDWNYFEVAPESSASGRAGGVSRVRFDAQASQRKFSVIVMLLSRVHKLLSTNSNGTRRQLYYEQVGFLRSQREVDDNALCVSRLVGLPPWQLGLLATAKGLVAGHLTLTTTEGQVLDCRNKPGGVLIPGDVCSIDIVQSSARFILVVEKDTIFQRVLREGALDRLGPCIIVTAKGYPDVSTRVLLARLEAELKIPMLALVDADSHGAHIMCVYRFGTKNCPLRLRSLRWLGLLPSELVALGVRSVALTARDAALARSLLDRPYLRDCPGVHGEVETLLNQGVKGEIDGLIEFSSCYITDVYLPNKIAAANAL